ncbi:MAG TPA: DUF1735 domain-containing protein [Chitinophagaceae bacterium]|jgi:hypothetical protein|nr:DUF1735 domain-containing protein [Chitinophagaceae bacterium]HMU57715.1 DUF1735 domain-containing protein [Chitinophagaceae bacterium]
MKKYLLSLLGTSAIFLTSCLKDKNVEDQVYGLNGAEDARLVEIIAPNTAADPSSAGHLNSVALDFENADLTLDVIEVRLTSKDLPKTDVAVTLSLANSATIINDYNTANSTSYVQMATTLYQIPSLTVTIPAGQRSAMLKLKTNAINYDPSTTYALGFTIGSISDASFGASGNFKNLLVTFGAKNAYDGLYEISGTLVDANGVYTGYYPGSLYFDPSDPRKYSLTTISGTAGLFYDEWFPYANYIVQNIGTGGFANTGIRPVITFDPTTNKVVSVTNSNNATQVFTVGASSKFNPSDHSIDLQWTLGRWAVTEHWKYIGPR